MTPIEHIRLSQQARDQLIKVKARTGIKHWNTLCRWAFVASLMEPTVPPMAKIPADSSVELSWKVFGGADQDVYLALLKYRCKQDGMPLTDEVLATQFRLHLHRGIGYIFADKKARNISEMLRKVARSQSRRQ